ncbi:hypothetical protein [Deinococcus pimensis]|uniref:hypothetical protein n=1 Tax=Deinococcus pimensis TaxID=309888 RepID=UPI000488FDFF|nr:hypothetical protein [Deinococcus pimensis]
MKTFGSLHHLTRALAGRAPLRGEGEGDKGAAAQRLLDRHNGDFKAVIDKLLDEAHGYREKIRTLTADVEKSKLPDGSVVLTKEQAAAWEAYQALGKPEDVKKNVEDGRVALDKLAGVEKRAQLDKVAKAMNWDPETFAELDTLAGGLTWDVQEVTKGDQKVTQVSVKGADGKTTDADAFAEERWKKFLPVLKLEASNGDEQQQDTRTDSGTGVPLGGAGGGKPRPANVDEVDKRKAESGLYQM